MLESLTDSQVEFIQKQCDQTLKYLRETSSVDQGKSFNQACIDADTWKEVCDQLNLTKVGIIFEVDVTAEMFREAVTVESSLHEALCVAIHEDDDAGALAWLDIWVTGVGKSFTT